MHLKPQILGTLHLVRFPDPHYVKSVGESDYSPPQDGHWLASICYLILFRICATCWPVFVNSFFYLVFVPLVGQYLLTHFIQDLCHWLAQCRRLTREMKWAWHSLQGSIYIFHHHQHFVQFTILHLSPHLCGTKSDWRQYSIFAIFAPACVKEKNNYWQTANCVRCMEFS